MILTITTSGMDPESDHILQEAKDLWTMNEDRIAPESLDRDEVNQTPNKGTSKI